MASAYLREALRFIGVSDVRFGLIGPTAGPGAIRPRGHSPFIAPDGLKLLTEAFEKVGTRTAEAGLIVRPAGRPILQGSRANTAC